MKYWFHPKLAQVWAYKDRNYLKEGLKRTSLGGVQQKG